MLKNVVANNNNSSGSVMLKNLVGNNNNSSGSLVWKIYLVIIQVTVNVIGACCLVCFCLICFFCDDAKT